eukprot:6200222-Pleurochrysis_carterae.AAC.3
MAVWNGSGELVALSQIRNGYHDSTRYCLGSFLAGANSKISHTGGRLICHRGPASEDKNEIIRNFTRA